MLLHGLAVLVSRVSRARYSRALFAWTELYLVIVTLNDLGFRCLARLHRYSSIRALYFARHDNLGLRMFFALVCNGLDFHFLLRLIFGLSLNDKRRFTVLQHLVMVLVTQVNDC